MFPLWAPALVWLICSFATQPLCGSAMESSAASKKACDHRKTCKGIVYDIHEAVCCENQFHPGAGLSCCGKEPFNPALATCCKVKHGGTLTATVTVGLSEKVSTCCGKQAYNPLNEICRSTVAAKPVPMGQTLGTFDGKKQLRCGRIHDKRILPRRSSHQCCGPDQYDTMTHCCCGMTVLQIQPIRSECCVESSAQTAAQGVEGDVSDLRNPLNKQHSQSKRTPKTGYCGEVPFDVDEQMCCGPKNDNHVLSRNSIRHQCCSNHDQYDTETECCCMVNGDLAVQPISSICCPNDPGARPQSPAPRTYCTEPHTSLCGSSCYNPNEFHCCERNQTTSHWCCNSGPCDATPTVYNPRTHVCCDGCLSEWKPWIDQCCGPSAYGLAQCRVLCCNNTLYKNREDGEKCSEMSIPFNPAKGTICCSQFHGSPGQHCCGTETYRPHVEICCDGHRHPKVEHGHCCGIHTYNIKDPQMKCCAGILYNLSTLGKHGQEAQCCGSILQTPQEGLRCCGHPYIHPALWSCCAESVANLNKTDLCEEMKVGTVESVSLHSIVFMGVLKIHGINATVKALPSPYVLDTPDRCNSPLLIPGKAYFFKGFKVFTDFNHDNTLLSVHFIISTCYHP